MNRSGRVPPIQGVRHANRMAWNAGELRAGGEACVTRFHAFMSLLVKTDSGRLTCAYSSAQFRRVTVMPRPENKPRDCLLNTQQVAKRLCVSTRTVCLWAECGQLPGFKVGRQWRFRRSAIDTWLSDRVPTSSSDVSSYRGASIQ
jgi:excisionase family DNA binding protein